ncbi:MAG: Nicotinate phosphoribosyltransferase [Candidatus Collierbacteria bacterium GW2011_GWB1_44_6]|uniref:Nicotinate phosphoribosyltransferase n=1 Tax=Candidatus Collierbacteria bacterium GW2011_GWB1_44_6 TaxID=1618384 RepID=A0A0G1LXB4_9BACT|nr:MAG: Nicotinate phosphoribosyltransferase [Candidatus Collierbacteria bacterium GW2011_GWB1_44_6]
MILPKTRYTTDGYKLSVGYIFWYWNMVRGMDVQGRYMFVDRDGRQYPKTFADQLREKFFENAELPARPEISRYTADNWPFIPEEYLRWYDRVFYFDPSQIDLSQKGGDLWIYYEGPLHTVNHHEIISLFDISNLITENFGYKPKYRWQDRVHHDARILKERGVTHSHGGGRRANSRKHHDEVLGILSQYKEGVEKKGGFFGESFIDMAYEHNLMIMGTMGHEFPMACAGIWGVENANRMARKIWRELYGKNLGYWLDDTWGTEWSDKEMTAQEAKDFRGSRHDSWPFERYVDQKLNFYKRRGVDSREKEIISSEGMKTLEDIVHTTEYKAGKFKPASLLGKFWTNYECVPEIPTVSPRTGYNIVNKLVAVKVGDGPWKDVCKLSNDISKAVGKPEAIAEAIAARDAALAR